MSLQKFSHSKHFKPESFKHDLGRVWVYDFEQLCHAVFGEIFEEASKLKKDGGLTPQMGSDGKILPSAAGLAAACMVVGFSGGSTPKALFKWAAQQPKNFANKVRELPVLWSVSDERCVPMSSEQSNFGNVARGFLKPLGIAESKWLHWVLPEQTEFSKEVCEQAARHANACVQKRFGAERSLDICFLGMGDDAHTASLFPNCPLIEKPCGENFAAVHWEGKGWRLTITPEGLARCGRIFVLVNGAAKAMALKQVFCGSYTPLTKPIQLLRDFAPKVDWLLDPPAAELLCGALK